MNSGNSPSSRGQTLRELALPGITIEVAESISGSFPDYDGSLLPIASVFRVRGVARLTPGSCITFELWLPENGWDGRYYQLGNGGFAGNINYSSLALYSARGNAVAVTDTGHGGGGGSGFDARWATGQPEAVIDYGHRSIKVTSDACAALIRFFFDRPAAHRYYVGCSNGGRQALMAAQRYPDDWDGIVAVAPANCWTRQLTLLAELQHHLWSVPGAWVPPAKLPAIQRAALAACPPDTVHDRVADNPELCVFDPAQMIGDSEERDDCLTAAQADSVRRIMAAGYDPTTAAVPDNWSMLIVNPDPEAPSQRIFATQAFRHLLGNDPLWNIADFDAARDIADATMCATLDAVGSYDRFRERGGRIISAFGWADALISPVAGLDSYRRLVSETGGAEATQAFYRLFMVPGMMHCQGGPGPDCFGQSVLAPARQDDRRHSICRAIEAWVEDDLAPDELVAARYVDGDRAKGVVGTRILYPENG
ncbi:tannase/feruloyl esterase family alpha/beta hydrolase [Sphingopyxis sp.]|uniref:tannase/feruloyl esterase family alpha/beta hydrolase n=1 Tax=Sphingopyxis sp. TaxID=1908224 RepID=UPI003D6CBBE7